MDLPLVNARSSFLRTSWILSSPRPPPNNRRPRCSAATLPRNAMVDSGDAFSLRALFALAWFDLKSQLAAYSSREKKNSTDAKISPTANM